MKTWQQHYDEFRAYCRTLTDAQLGNVLEAERKRHNTYPDDDCYDACYKAAVDEWASSGN